MIYKKIMELIKKYSICSVYRMDEEYEIDFYNAEQMLLNKESIFLVDVRSPQEYKEGHLKKSINIPIYNLKYMIQKAVPNKNTYLILYCQTGNRSIKAVKMLRKMGYEKIYSIKGGLDNK